MTSGQTAREIDEDAAGWALRLDDSVDPAVLENDLQTWLAGDARRNGALLRAQAALSLTDRARALPAVPLDSLKAAKPDASRRWLLAAGGIATAAGVATLLGPLVPRPDRIQTRRGEQRRVPLADGSVADINTDTALAVLYTRHRRRIEMERGEAWFSVAKDRERPFLVETPGLNIQAVGTAFSVNLATARRQVLVTEGVVEAWLTDQPGHRVRVEANSRLTMGADGLFEIASSVGDIARDLAWRSGQIDLAGRTVRQAIDEFNRYAPRPLILDDPALGDEVLVGLFNTNDAESFAQAVSAALGASVRATPTSIHLGRKVPQN
jgi:transmembrane sensor